MKRSDKIFSQPLAEMVDFRFDDRVAAVFPDMIQRSVPGYATLITQIGLLSGHYAQPGSVCYDLGCSLGAVSLAMQQNIDQPDIEIMAVDNAPAMIERARPIFANQPADRVPVSLHCADILDMPVRQASVVVMNFTLQFIARPERDALIRKIYQGLLPGGVLLLSEKLQFKPDTVNHVLIEGHHQFKRANGYSELEISQKRSALENVLVPETRDTHIERLQQAGFSAVESFFQCYNFAAFFAVK